MTTKTVQILITYGENGVAKGAIQQVATYDENGQHLGNTDHALSIVHQSVLDSATSSIAQLTADKAALTASQAALSATVSTLQNQLGGLAGLQTQLAEALALVEQYRPFNPNEIRSKAFYDRITGDERFALGVLAMTDETAKGILSLLSAYLANEWKVVLDDPQLTGAMGYLASAGVLTSGRASEITRPATKDEAYLA
jgi:hypothetical protein